MSKRTPRYLTCIFVCLIALSIVIAFTGEGD